MVAKLEPLAAPDRPFRLSVRELQALVAARKGDLKRARELWTEISKDPQVPQGTAAAHGGDARPSTAPRRRSRAMAKRVGVRSIVPGPSRRLLLDRVAVRMRRRSMTGSARARRRCRASAPRSSPNAATSSPTRTWPMCRSCCRRPRSTIPGRSPAASPTTRCTIWRSAIRRRSSGRPMSARARASSRILTTPPVVAEGKVFAKDAQGTVSAFNADTGQLIWRVTLKPEKARDDDEFGGGLAYYGGQLFVTTGFASVFSLDPNDGKEIWNSSVSAPVRGAPLVFGDRVFVISIDNKLAGPCRRRRLGALAVSRPDGKRGLCRRQQPGRLERLHRGAFLVGRAGRPAHRQRPAGVERDDDRLARRGAGLRQPERHSRPPRDRSRRRAGDGHGRPARRGRAATAASACGSAASAATRRRGSPAASRSSLPAAPTSPPSAATRARSSG